MTRLKQGGSMWRWTFGRAVLAGLLVCGINPAQAQTRLDAVAPAPAPALGRPALAVLATGLSAAAQALAGRVVGQADHGQRPFAIVDKQAALLAVYHADGTLAAVSPALLGRDIGDLSVPGVGDRAQAGRLRPGDATTPAGRFASSPGRNRFGEAVVWVDYSAAFAIHRLRPGAALPERARRLASVRPSDKRFSAGCVVVPAVFYQAVVEPMLGRGPATVYVLPESPPGQVEWQGVWQALAQPPAKAAAGGPQQPG